MSLAIQIDNALSVVQWLAARAGPVAVGAAIPTAMALVRVWFQAREARRLAAEAAFNEALNSDDLKRLSAYLRDEFGRVPLSIYLRDADLRIKLDKYLVRLTDFVAPPAEGGSPKVQSASRFEAETPAPQTTYWQNEPSDPDQIVAALESARGGESWNALARLRRDLEARFRAELMGSDPNGSRVPMHKVPVPADAEYVFRRFYRSASRAIHGEDVTEDEVIQAIQDARTVYRTMEQISPGWSTQPVSLVQSKRRAIF